MSAAICVTCKFWFEYPENHMFAKYKSGECRRYAPSHLTQWGVVNQMGPGSEESHPALWPATNKGDWCGEHKFKGTE
ncbi:MAG: hypothetical protein ACFFKA_16600 [Candidatus Thorarchaeota archaeon]